MAARNFYVPGNHAFNSNGLAVPGATATLYGSGTSTPKAFYSNSALSVSLGSTITANGIGRFPTAYGDDTVAYRLIIKDKLGATLDDIDPFHFGQTIVTIDVNGATPQIDGALGDGVTDDHTALQAWLDRGGLLRLPVSEYYSSDNLILRKNAVIEGEGYGFDARTVDATADLGYDDQPGAKIRFAVGKGFQVQPQTTVTDVATAVAAGVGGFTQQGGAHSVIRNLALVGAGTGASVAGFYSRILVHLENVHVLKFQGRGFDLSASGTTPDGNSEYGALNGATLRNCRAVYNGSHGFHIRGTDANACTFINCTAQLNGGWGFLDESALGNTYVGGEAATNTSGSYKCIGAVAVSSYYGCYAETGTGRAPDLSSQCLVSGGVLSGAASSVNVGSNGNPTNIVSTGISSPQLNFTAAQNEAVASATNAKVFRGANSGLILQGAPNGGGTFDVSIFNKNAALVVGISTGTLQTRLFGETAIDFNGLFFNGPSTWAGAFGSDGSARVFSTAAGGLQLYGQGSSYDVSLGNKVGTIALRVPTNTTNVQVVGSLSVGGVSVFNGSGVLQAAAFPALTGDVTTSAGALASTIAANVVTYAKFQQVAASSLVGNPTGSLANAQAITLAGGLAFSGTTLTAAGALTPTSVASTGAVTSSSATAGIGYASGSRGTQTQATSKATGVTSNTAVTDITLNGAALAASTTVSFVFTNSAIAANDTLTLNHVTTGTFGSYTLNAHGFGAGSCTIDVRNVSLGSLSEAIVIRAVLVKGG